MLAIKVIVLRALIAGFIPTYHYIYFYTSTSTQSSCDVVFREPKVILREQDKRVISL